MIILPSNLTTIKVSVNELDNLIHGLQLVRQKLSEERDVEINIDFNNGNLITKVLPIPEDEFKIQF